MLVMSVFAFTSMLLGLTGLVSANHEVEELFDARLAQHARLLLQMNADTYVSGKQPTFLYPSAVSTQREYDLTEVGHHYESKIYFRIWRNDELVASSEPILIEANNSNAQGFSYTKNGEYEWRTFELSKQVDADTKLRVLVAERSDVRGEMVAEIVLNAMIPELMGWPLIAVFVWMAVGYGLNPLKHLTSRIKMIEPAQLKPMDVNDMPSELAPIQQAINILLLEIDELIAREKRWIADAAHELRTPLAVLKIHTQNIEAAESTDDRQHAIHQLKSGVERSTRIVSQLLSYARVESQLGHAVEHEQIDVMKSTRAIVAELFPMIWEKKINIELDEDSAPIYYPMEKNHLEIIIQNLISNAVKFTPVNGKILVTWLDTVDELVLSFSDNGIGVTPEDIGRLTERFFKVGNQHGAGLGLAIVATLVKYYHGHIDFGQNEPQGFKVTVHLPKQKHFLTNTSGH